MRLKYLQKLSRINILKRQQKNPQATFFSSQIVNKAVKYLFYQNNKMACAALTDLTVGRINKAALYLKKYRPEIGILLFAHFDTAKAYTQMQRHRQKIRGQSPYFIYLPALAYLMFDYKVFLKEISAAEQTRRYRNMPLFNYMKARALLYEGDMQAAAKYAEKALKIWKKADYIAEEAECYKLLAEIYRLSCIDDVAQLILAEALKIYERLNLPQHRAETLAVMGMLLLFQNQPDAAAQKYDAALELCMTETLQADIYNQQSLLQLAQNMPAKAEKMAVKAYEINKKYKRKNSMAFSLQLIAQTSYKRRQYRKSATTAANAADIYKKCYNHSARFECLYLEASALHKSGKYAAAENLLHLILTESKNKRHGFHLANVYTLLGTIYLQKNDLPKAKEMWQCSLQLEQQQQRNHGMAVDYANLALIEEMCNNKEEAQQKRQLAVECATLAGDEGLIKLIKNKYEPFS